MKPKCCKIFLILFAPVLFAAQTLTNQYAGSQQPSSESDSASEQIYKDRCAVCHDKPTARIPPRSLIAKQSNEDVVRTLTSGTMKQWAEGLSADQIRALAVYLTGKQPSVGVKGNLNEDLCKDPAEPINLNGLQWNGWGRDLDNSRYQPQPGIKPEDVSRLKVKWAWTHPGPMATGQPIIIGDRLFVTTEVGQLYSLNAQTGCTYRTIHLRTG